MDWSLIFTGIGLGLAYTAAPGAVNTEAIRRGVTHGARSALLVETGSLIGDVLWAGLALAGVSLLAQYFTVQIILGIAGGFFLLRLAWLAFSEAIAQPKTVEHTGSSRGDFTTGIVFGLANPLGLAFWSGLGGSVLATGATGLQFGLFFGGFFIGAVLWCLFISLTIRWGRRWIRPVLFRWINILCGLALGYFGLRLLWTTLQDWIEHISVQSLKEHS